MAWLYYIIVIALQIAGLFINLLGLPGLWVMVCAAAVFAWLTRISGFISNFTLIALIVLAFVAELIEFLAASSGAKKAGGRKRSMVGATIGGLLGGFFLTFIPIPIISTIVGVCLGCFLGAAIAEFYDKDAGHAVRVGLGAAQGRFYGIVIKAIFGFIILVITIVAAFPVGGATTKTIAAPSSRPAQTPTTAATSSTNPM